MEYIRDDDFDIVSYDRNAGLWSEYLKLKTEEFIAGIKDPIQPRDYREVTIDIDKEQVSHDEEITEE